MAKKSSAATGTGVPAPSRKEVALRNLLRTAAQNRGHTGRYLIGFRSGQNKAGRKLLLDKAGIRTVSSQEAGFDTDTGDEHRLLEKLGVVAAPMDQDQFTRLALKTDDSAVQFVIPEGIKTATINGGIFPTPPTVAAPMSEFYPGLSFSPEYLQGYRDGVSALVNGLVGSFAQPAVAGPVLQASSFPGGGPIQTQDFRVPDRDLVPGVSSDQLPSGDTAWHLDMCNVTGSGFTGAGVKVAILDTGIDLDHPDFDGRIVAERSFVDNRGVQDNHGHGTHCAGIACGPQRPGSAPRYGVACDAELAVGKVLTDSGAGVDGHILEGIEWAIAQGCVIISLSLGEPAQGSTPNPMFESRGKRALAAGIVPVAAAGNGSRRNLGRMGIRPSDAPANGVWYLSVGALDSNRQVAPFSNAGLFPPAGAVDVAAPGVQIFSAASRTARVLPPTVDGLYRYLSGTSQATPMVAGVLALIAEKEPTFSSFQLASEVLDKAEQMPDPVSDVGHGLLQAP